MRYTSTRADLDIDFATVVASGLAPGGGLYLPQIWPHIDQAELERLGAGSYAQALAFVGGLFDGGALSAAAWADIARKALAGFRHSAIAPLNQLGAHHWLLELFHGPTLSFKDYGLQPLSQLLAALSAHKARKLFILGATSGDTGSAAIAAFRGQPGARIVILHPHGRVSEVQRRQMTTVDDANVLNLAVEGSFDDCQRFAKALLAERAERPDEAVLSVNSINWGRLYSKPPIMCLSARRWRGRAGPLPWRCQAAISAMLYRP
jgi:threonine synthase